MSEEIVIGVPRQVEQDERGGRFLIGERAVGVRSHAHAPAVAALVAGLAQRRWPVYLRVDGDSGELVDLLVPDLVRVGRVVREGGRLDVELVPSQARHHLVLEGEGVDRMRELLEQSAQDGTVLVVTEDDDHRILDVRRPDPDVALPRPLPPRVPRERPFLTRVLDLGWLTECIDVLTWYLFPTSYARAKEAFDALNTLSCDPLTVPPPCIPFRYPDDGCWGRAHEMCRLMKGMSVHSRKVWIQGWLGPSTRNNPSCEVHWGWHVAPTLRVRRSFWGFFFTSTYVVDPALFTGPVPQATWKDVQKDPNASLTPTAAWIFWLWDSGRDDDNSQTEGVLATYRAKLQARSLSSVGPPPYAYCP